MRAKIGDWITIRPHAQVIWEENNPDKRFLIIGFRYPHHVILHDDNCRGLSVEDIRNYGADPIYLGKTWWFLADSSIQDIFSVDLFHNTGCKNLSRDEDCGGLNYL
jgi:hypothetical protein